MDPIDAENKSGGPAFPRFVPDGHYNGSIDVPGMTLHDYFAAHAPTPPKWIFQQYIDEARSFDAVASIMAEWANTYADAMLKARPT